MEINVKSLAKATAFLMVRESFLELLDVRELLRSDCKGAARFICVLQNVLIF